MADISVDPGTWSSTASSNSPSGATNIGTGLDDNLRAIQAGIKATIEPLSSVAGTNTITATCAGLTAYYNGETHSLYVANANTGAATINVNSIGAKNIFLNGAAVVAGEMQPSVPVTIQYDGTQFNIVGNSGYSGGIPGKQGSDIASASTTNLDTATGDLVDVTGTTTITAITLSQGRKRVVRFTGALTLTNGASLVLPGGASITTAAGDYAIFAGYASSVVRCVAYIKATGASVISSGITSSMGSDVALNNNSTYFAGPSVAQGSAGTWFVSGTVTVTDTAVQSEFQFQLTDGTAIIASADGVLPAANNPMAVSLSGVITSPAGNLRIAVKDSSANSGKILFNKSGNSKDSTITAIRIA